MNINFYTQSLARGGRELAMKKKTETEIKIDSLLADLPAEERKGGGEVSGLAVRSLSLEELASVAGGVGPIYDDYGGTETHKQGTTQDTKNDGYS